jgi:F0F1-type ATP synthase assembly protein I
MHILYIYAMHTQQKISLGAALASIAGTGIALSSIFGWTSLVRPWGFLVGFVLGVAAGAGVVMAIAGLLEHRRTK